MRGSLVHRGKNRWALVLDLGYVTDPETGTRKRKEKWVAFRGDKKQAGDKLTELTRAMNRGRVRRTDEADPRRIFARLVREGGQATA